MTPQVAQVTRQGVLAVVITSTVTCVIFGAALGLVGAVAAHVFRWLT